MKIQCDVCNKHEATVYCSADEAALCSACDHRVHHANKLAGKHPRFSLLHPSPENTPLCDICQDKKAFAFCQQDRAILCKDCDASIHKVNQLKQNHNRFLLTGVKLSPTASVYSCSNPPASLPSKQNGVVPEKQQQQQQPVVPSSIMNQTNVKVTNCDQELNQSGHGSGHGSGASSISEYLIDMLPGWHVEDFLDPPANLAKVGDNDPGPIWGSDLIDGSLNNSFSPESMGIWVPQAPPPVPAMTARYAHVLHQFESGSSIGFGDQMINGSTVVFGQNDYNNVNKVANGKKSSRNWVSDNGNCFMVPQISPSSMSTKRSRTLWN
ncbi:hypothetical protein QVD17_39059 [Tagetes erecta]|uniref:B box-type domain-containing protein n=1 Tax=Tagetes erecta TaxID=13708 RepID=A0AAD8JQ02_TARER|nr:hypothetical protein QVD17_39059 [Tagetes erecta]